MIVSLAFGLITLSLSASASPFPTLALPTSTPTQQSALSTITEILCYDSRYAIHKPSTADCATILNHQLATPFMTRNIIFSRHPLRSQFALPHMWRTERGECAVVIDIPELPTQKFIPAAQASMLDIKRAAFEVLMSCVVNGDHLGGITHTGVGKHLQVRIEAVEPESLGGYASEAET